jgi:subtilisin family serine protease
VAALVFQSYSPCRALPPAPPSAHSIARLSVLGDNGAGFTSDVIAGIVVVAAAGNAGQTDGGVRIMGGVLSPGEC